MNILVKKIDKTYGGYTYIEFNPITKLYAKGNSRSHSGHGHVSVEIYVTTNTALTNALKDLEREDYTKVNNMRDEEIII